MVNAWKSIASISVLAVQPLYSLGSGSNIPVCVAFAFCQRNCFWIRNGLCCHFDSFLSKNCIWQTELQQDYFLNYHWYFISSYAGGLLAISTLYRLNIFFCGGLTYYFENMRALIFSGKPRMGSKSGEMPLSEMIQLKRWNTPTIYNG